MKSQRICSTLSYAFLSVALTLLMGCSSQRPVVYPNAHLQEVGDEQAEKDMVACEQLAEEHVSESNAGAKVVGQTAIGGAIGAAGGAVIGAITGDPGIGAAIGAAAGAAQGLIRGLLGAASSDPNPAYQKFVNRCLKEAGYETTG
ncbi:MAG: glycine zipper family protein [Nitrospirota bacterium]|nr:glycine zipper family protein [Nitrospirota bacterium]MDH5699224.1 glycine zipper family protein [Nitrospirota bacterium]